MAELTITELRKMAKDHNEKFIKCSKAIDKAVSAISAREDCNGVEVSEGTKICNLTEFATEAEKISAHRNSRRVVNDNDDIYRYFRWNR